MKSEDWEYAGEGGKHALFSYQPNNKEPGSFGDGDPSSRSRWIGRLLRLEKKYLAAAAHSLDLDGVVASDRQSHDNDNEEESESIRFLRHFVKPHLEYYLDLPESLSLSWSFVKELKDSTLKCRPCPIPEARRSSWKSIGGAEQLQQLQKDIPLGTLLWDYRSIPPTKSLLQQVPTLDTTTLAVTSVSSCACWSMEIKPKAGYTATSSLVDPEHHTAKFYQSRFVLLQTLDRLGYGDQIDRGWKKKEKNTPHTPIGTTETAASPSSTTSSYDPMDLFSFDATRIQTALECLWACPQNNFKLWFAPPIAAVSNNDTTDNDDDDAALSNCTDKDPILLRADKQYYVTTPPTDENEQQHDFFSSSTLPTLMGAISPATMSGIPTKDMLLQLTTAVLCAENHLMNQLLRLQRLDILDADGAVLIYQKLVELLGGSHTEAQQCIDQYAEPQGNSTISSSGLGKALQWSPLDVPKEAARCPAFVALCQELDRFALVLKKSQEGSGHNNNDRDANPMIAEHKASHLFCRQQIAAMESKAACVYLLQNWLLSLLFCDVSFFVTLQNLLPNSIWSLNSETPLAASLPSDNTAANPHSTNNASTRVHRQQTQDGPGVIVLQMHQGQSSSEGAQTGFQIDGEAEIATTHLFQYEIKAIDCDRKPSKKLQNRRKKEQLFRLLSTH